MEKWIYFLYLLLLSVWDVKERRIPVWLLSVGTVIAGGVAVYQIAVEQISWLRPLLGVLPGAFLLVIAWLSGKAGYADGIVLLCIGMMWGYRESLLSLCVSLMLISLVSIVLLMLRKVKRYTKIPYIPFLTVGFLLVNSAIGG